MQIKELEHELDEVREAARKYEEGVSGFSQEEDLELMDSQVIISFVNENKLMHPPVESRLKCLSCVACIFTRNIQSFTFVNS